MKLALLSRLTAAPTTRARSLGFLAWLFWLDVKASLQLASGGFSRGVESTAPGPRQRRTYFSQMQAKQFFCAGLARDHTDTRFEEVFHVDDSFRGLVFLVAAMFSSTAAVSAHPATGLHRRRRSHARSWFTTRAKKNVWPTVSWSRRRITRRPTAGLSIIRPRADRPTRILRIGCSSALTICCAAAIARSNGFPAAQRCRPPPRARLILSRLTSKLWRRRRKSRRSKLCNVRPSGRKS